MSFSLSQALDEILWGENALQIAWAFSSSLPQAQQLTDLEQKLAVAKDELEKAALDKVSGVTVTWACSSAGNVAA